MTWGWENQNHEWTRMDTNGEEGGELNHEKHENTRNDAVWEKQNHEWTRRDTNGEEGGEEGS